LGFPHTLFLSVARHSETNPSPVGRGFVRKFPPTLPAEMQDGILKEVIEQSRADTKARLQYLVAGTAGAAVPQGAGYGAVTDRAAVLKSVVSKPPFGVCFRLEHVDRQPTIQQFFICRFRWRLGLT